MTRLLSQLLGAREPLFQLSLQQLERSAGRPSTDIRLSSEIHQAMLAKLRELQLDPNDTSGQELYAVLGARLHADEQRFAKAIRARSTKTDDPIAHVALAIEREISGQTTLALKNTVAKKILKTNIPKKTMKALGYRSADSMLKHETAASLYAASWLIENEQWTKKVITGYSKLKAADFEQRKISIEHPTSKRWQTLAEGVVAERRHNILSFKELGSVVLLPLPDRPAKRPELITLTTAVLTIHAINEIQAAGTFLKLHQVQSNFGSVVKQVVTGEPTIPARLLDQPVSWNTVQHYYSRLSASMRADIFEPVIHAEDLVWHKVEQVLATIEPSLRFWQGTELLGMLHAGQAVTFNLSDQVLSHCNALPFAERQLQHFRAALNTELTLRYMNHDQLQQTISGQFQKQLASEPVMALA